MHSDVYRIDNIPYPGRIPRQPYLRKGDDSCTLSCGFRDEVDHLLHGSSEIEPNRLGLRNGNFDGSHNAERLLIVTKKKFSGTIRESRMRV